MRLFGLAVILTAVATPLVAAGQPTTQPGACEPTEAMIIKVMPLTYARSGELAHTLSWIAPPRVRIVPHYPPTAWSFPGLQLPLSS
jgi:hypothetical protein